jgi:hypothetical protein
MKNTPYVKKYGNNGLVANPITKQNPYLHQHENTIDVRNSMKNSKNNKKGIRLVVRNLGKGVFAKYKVVTQFFQKPNFKGKKQINHYIPV